ncbi:MAG: hypothetical protein SOX25_00730 [Eubacteriales bacterium]|nr:hypothetical protein [Eubacteriales bacterium]
MERLPSFPHPLDYLPRPGRREIRLRPGRQLPGCRHEKEQSHGTE